MAKQIVKILLTEKKTIGGEIRDPRFVLMQGPCNENVTWKDVSKAIQRGQVEVVSADRSKKIAEPGEGAS